MIHKHGRRTTRFNWENPYAKSPDSDGLRI